jgi:phenol 2-monooxygenase
MRRIDREFGCVVIVRPDQFVAHVLPLDTRTGIAAFFEPILLAPAVAYP